VLGRRLDVTQEITMRKVRLLALGLGALLPLAVAAPASADVADGTRLKGGGPFCAFTLVIRDVVNQRQESTTTLNDGSTVVTTTGTLLQSLENQATHEKIIVDVSGTTTVTTSADGTAQRFVGDDRNLLIFGPNGQKNTGEPPVALTDGHVIVTAAIDPATGVGTAQKFSLGGTQVDVCALLS
jgi:hypothetical protein